MGSGLAMTPVDLVAGDAGNMSVTTVGAVM